MKPAVVVVPVLSTVLNTTGVIRACKEMGLANPAAEADKKGLSGFKHLFAVLDAMHVPPSLSKNMAGIGYMIAAWPDDLADILAHTSGMSHFRVDGVERFAAAMVSGSVSDWLRACETACHVDSPVHVRYTFNRVYRDLEKKIPIMKRTTDNGDGTFLLEYK